MPLSSIDICARRRLRGDGCHEGHALRKEIPGYSTTPAAAVAFLAGMILALSLWAFTPAIALLSCFLGWTMLAVAAIDARRFIVPDVLSLPAIPAGLMATGALFDPHASGLVNVENVIGMVAGGLSLYLLRALYFWVRRREGLGLGDVKLAAAGGAWIGWQHLSTLFLLASVLALGAALTQAMHHRTPLSGSTRLPFGAFLAPSIWLIWSLDAYSRGL
jgi:leader peptidase (prepilin peptidase) / N-methyltransferase